jgi:hypothetical protein
MPTGDYFTIAYERTDPSGGGPTQTLYFRFTAEGDYKGLISLDYDLDDTDEPPGGVEQVAGVDLPAYAFLYYNDSEQISVVVSNVPQHADFTLTLKGTSGTLYAEATGTGKGAGNA